MEQILTFVLIYVVIVLYPSFNKAITQIFKDLALIITYIIAYVIKIWKYFATH